MKTGYLRMQISREMVTAALLLLFLPASHEPVLAQVQGYEQWPYVKTIQPEGYVCYRVSGAIKLDGRLDEPSWKAAPWTAYFVDIEGARKPLPRFKTHVKMIWDDKYFYIGAELEEPHVWGTLTFRDQIIYLENDFEVFIDPNSDNHEYYEIELGPLNTVWDLYMPVPYKDFLTGIPFDAAWELPGMKTAVSVDGTINDPRDVDKGWSVEFAIPWTALAQKAHRPSPPRHGDQWRVNFSRVEYVHDIVTSDRSCADMLNNAYKTRAGIPCDNWVWSPQGFLDMHRPEMFGYVQFSTAKPGTDTFHLDPTFAARVFLHGLYYAQRDFNGKNGRWAGSLQELGLDYSKERGISGTPVIELTTDGYIAHVTANLQGGKTRAMSIRQDSLVREE
jgi:hypothetical protein